MYKSAMAALSEEMDENMSFIDIDRKNGWRNSMKGKELAAKIEVSDKETEIIKQLIQFLQENRDESNSDATYCVLILIGYHPLGCQIDWDSKSVVIISTYWM